MKFIIAYRGSRALVLAAPSFFDARAQANKLLAEFLPHDPVREIDITETDPTAIEDYEIEWRGTDAGPKPNRTLYVRHRPREGKVWLPWRVVQ